MRITGAAKRLRIYIGESDQWRGKPLYAEVLETLKREGLAGATVLRGVAGFGAHSRIHTAAILRLSEDLPLIVEVIDKPEQIEKALGMISPMVREGLITLEEVQVIKYTHRYLQPLPGDTLVRDVMTRDVVSVSPETPIAEVVDLLIGKLFKAVPVVDSQKHVVGIISDGDLLARGGMQQRLSIAERLDAKTLSAQIDSIRHAGKTARDVMTSPVIIARADESLARAVSLMARHTLKRLPIVNPKEILVGMLSRVDVLRTVVNTQPSRFESALLSGVGRTVGEVMNPDVPTVTLEAELADIAEKMVTATLKRVIVINGEGKAVGIINDGDLVARVKPETRSGVLRVLARLALPHTLPTETAAQLMTPSVLTGPAHTPIAEAIRMMLEQKRKRFVVVDDQHHPIGIVDRQTLMHAIAGLDTHASQ